MKNKLPPLIFEIDYDALAAVFASWSEPNFRSRQMWDGIYKQLWSAPEEFTTMPKNLRTRLAESFRFSSLTTIAVKHSKDKQTSKTLFKLQDGHFIETILMHYRDRTSICISSQAGCALGCAFCATGQMGFKRNLTRGEIIEQVIIHLRNLKVQKEQLTNIVIMGMGEPFLNYKAVMGAIDVLNDPQGVGFGERRFTISTAGIIPGIRRFTAENRQINLAISLHAANDELRTSLMPINQKYPLKSLINACQEYTRKTNRRITFEWALISGVNDRRQDAQELVQWIKDMLCHVNLIPLNPTQESVLQASSQRQINQFKKILEDAGIACTVRLPRGTDIHAGCGQLAGRKIPLT